VAHVRRKQRQSSLDVDLRIMPARETMNSEGVTQIMYPRANATGGGL
jgi:hypothetical protein